MELYVTEHKSVGTLNPWNTSVRVFIDNDLRYGYFVPEHEMFALLTSEQQQAYLEGNSARLDVSKEVAQALIDMGHTIHAKPKLI